MSPKIVCVVPTIRPVQMESFKKAWAPLFEKHNVTLITVWDGEVPIVELGDCKITCDDRTQPNADLFCRFTDGCRNLGFVTAAAMNPDYILTLDDDVQPPQPNGLRGIEEGYDPIERHLWTLQEKVPLGWMSTTQGGSPYPRGMPYNVRNEAPVMLSHGVWCGVPDFDGETQLGMEQVGAVPKWLNYYVGPIPKGVLFPLCGMNVMIRKEALPYFYFAPMGPDSGVYEVCKTCSGGSEMYYNTPGKLRDAPCDTCNGNGRVYPLNRFSDIFMGIMLKRKFDELGWACYTGGSVVHHTRASDAKKNMDQERLSREWNEMLWTEPSDDPVYSPRDYRQYVKSYADKRQRYAQLITDILQKG